MGNGLSLSLAEFKRLPQREQLTCLYENQVKTIKMISGYRFHQKIIYAYLTAISIGGSFIIKQIVS